MLDQILAWVVIFFPTALSIAFIFVPSRRENERLHMKWRYSLIVVGILFSGITGWQQVRAIRASAKDRQNAIRETSERVAAQTSERVTEAVGEQYKGTIAALDAQISSLQRQLSVQERDVGVIKGSNIVTGKNPVKVEVINPGPSGPPSVLSEGLPTKERIAVVVRRHDLSEKTGRENIRKRLSELIAQGEELQSALVDPQLSDTDADAAVGKWDKVVQQFLDEHMGTDYVKQFRSTEGITYGTPLAAPNSKPKQELWRSIYARDLRLKQFLEGLATD
jgi:hypothetical protein